MTVPRRACRLGARHAAGTHPATRSSEPRTGTRVARAKRRRRSSGARQRRATQRPGQRRRRTRARSETRRNPGVDLQRDASLLRDVGHRYGAPGQQENGDRAIQAVTRRDVSVVVVARRRHERKELTGMKNPQLFLSDDIKPGDVILYSTGRPAYRVLAVTRTPNDIDLRVEWFDGGVANRVVPYGQPVMLRKPIIA